MSDNKRVNAGHFKKSQSGNPAGVKTGSRHHATMLAEKLLEIVKIRAEPGDDKVEIITVCWANVAEHRRAEAAAAGTLA